MRTLAALGMVAICACGSGGGGGDRPFERRELSADVLARPAIAYSGYRVGQSPDTQTFPTEEQIEEDLRLLVRGGWRWIRLFDSGTHAERVLRVIDRAELDIVVLLGVWIAGNRTEHDTFNRAEIERAVALATQYPGVVVAISVGNETLDDWSNVRVSPAELVEYMHAVRDRVTVPVTTDDSWYPFTFGRDGATSYEDVALVAAAADLLSLRIGRDKGAIPARPDARRVAPAVRGVDDQVRTLGPRDLLRHHHAGALALAGDEHRRRVVGISVTASVDTAGAHEESGQENLAHERSVARASAWRCLEYLDACERSQRLAARGILVT